MAVFAPLPKLFTYIWPASLGRPEAGIRVCVPFGRGRRLGAVTSTRPAADTPADLKAVLDRLDLQPLYDQARLRWLTRARQYYLASPGEIYETAFAWAGGDEKRRWTCLDRNTLRPLDAALADAFSSRSTLSAQALARRLGMAALYHRISQAVQADLIEEALPVLHTEDHETHDEPVPERLSAEQSSAVQTVMAADGFQPFLLFGKTGSGKTEVYLQAARAITDTGGQILILVPEIGLTPQWLARLAARFKKVGVWHSALTHGQRLAVRRRLHDTDVLVGTRSALFLPLPRLSLIVVDEEHDASFKQQEGVAYSSRDLAVLLAQELDVPVILGSATPSLESWRHVKSGRYRLLTLSRRIARHSQASPTVIDLCGGEDVLSESLIAALQETKSEGRQSLLYLNRRGYAPALHCTACGHVPECPSCSLRLTLHRKRSQLRCHACGFAGAAPAVCDQCGEEALFPLGAGTEKVEEQLKQALPELNFARLDRDAVSSEKKLKERLRAFAAGELDCLIGTQMLVKGHHFPNVTLVGVINADLGLSLPDFRAGERWWQQLTQVLGRAGRGDHPGRVMIQTYNPAAPWLGRIGDEQAETTLNEELELRRKLMYPPFSRWVRIVFSSRRSQHAVDAATSLAKLIEHQGGISLVGPMPSAIERLAGRFRCEILLRDETRKLLPWALAPVLTHLPVPAGVRRKVDVDPVDMM